ncbi:MAG: ImmA/IrrE family metallo-endopeptidase [Elusimicrobia bacterium]|nr:ImmA/IrrE family metallo-endopeptidase [Candidatus Liberimonas magnetica]
MKINDRLKAIRSAFGFTLQDVEKSTGIGVSSLSDFENDKREPSLSQLNKLSKLYEKPLTFFLDVNNVPEPIILWRKTPEDSKRMKMEAKFTTLCKQYKNLEVWTKSACVNSFNVLFAQVFPKDYNEVRKLAVQTGKQLDLGAHPSLSLLKVLEEVYGLKIFYNPLGDDASSACFYTDEFGPAVMLNSDSKQWRRNFDLAHELFHLITWKVRPVSETPNTPMKDEETFANHFASAILMPEESLRSAVESCVKDNKISVDSLDAIARQFDVSVEALCYRLPYIFSINPDGIKELIEKTKKYSRLPIRESETPPPDLPSRYRALAVTALNNGEISSQQFANYIGIKISEIDEYYIPGESNAIQINTGSM